MISISETKPESLEIISFLKPIVIKIDNNITATPKTMPTSAMFMIRSETLFPVCSFKSLLAINSSVFTGYCLINMVVA